MMKAKLKKLDDQSNIEYKVAANITEWLSYQNSSEESSKVHDDKTIISCKNVNIKKPKIFILKMEILTFRY